MKRSWWQWQGKERLKGIACSFLSVRQAPHVVVELCKTAVACVPGGICMRWLVLCVHLNVRMWCCWLLLQCFNSFIRVSSVSEHTVIRYTSVVLRHSAGGVFSQDCHTLTLLEWLVWRHYSEFSRGGNNCQDACPGVCHSAGVSVDKTL